MELYLFAAELLVYGAASFLAIIAWSRTRDVPWLFIVIGVISLYAANILHALDILGAVELDPLVYAGFSPVRTVVRVLPGIAFAAGLLSFIRSRW